MRKDSVRFVLLRLLKSQIIPSLICFSTPEEEEILRAIPPDVMRRMARSMSLVIGPALHDCGIKLE